MSSTRLSGICLPSVPGGRGGLRLTRVLSMLRAKGRGTQLHKGKDLSAMATASHKLMIDARTAVKHT